MKDNNYMIEYHKIKKQDGIKAIKLVDNDEKMDVYNLGMELFPDIDEKVFYGDQLPVLKGKGTYS